VARILVIDDDDRIRDVFRQILENAGYEVEDACDGHEGVRLYKEKNIDLVITDILMPGMSGLETILELRFASPDVKVIAISGGDHIAPEYYLNVIKNLDTMCELKKPISSQDLLSAVGALVSKE